MSRWSVLFGATAAIAFASISTSGCKNGGGADNLGFFIPPANLSAINSVIPNSGSILGSTSITIIGSNFGTNATARVGQTDLINIAQPNTFTLIGTIPPGNYTAGPADVSVLTSSQTAVLQGGYTFEDMTFTSITPNNGPISGNVPVVIRGTNFKNVPLNGVVLSGSNGTIIGTLGNVVVNATFDRIDAVVPSGLPLGAYNLIITSTSHGIKDFGAVYTVGTGLSTTMLITDIRSQPGNQSPAHGPLAGGTTVTLTADLTAPAPAGFVGGINVTLVFPGGQAANGTNILIAPNFGTLTFVTPAAPAGFFGGPVTVRVDSSTQGFATAVNGYNYDPVNSVPAINTISPAVGPQGGGTLVTVLGINFKSGSLSNVRRVLVGGVPAPGVAVQSTSQLQFTTPAGNSGLQPVVIESTTGAQSNTVNFNFLPSIVITSLDPNNGPVAGGGALTIRGQNFTTATVISGSISIGDKPILNLQVVNNTTVTGIVPAGAQPGPIDVKVDPNGGLLGMVLRQGYTYGPSFDESRNPVTFLYNATPVANQGRVAAVAVGNLAGTLDAVTVNSLDQTISIVPDVANLGSGAAVTVITNAALGGVLNNPIDVAIADMNGDGARDLVILNNGAGGVGQQQIVVLLNNGGGLSYTPAPGTPTNINTIAGLANLQGVSIAVDDFNSDARQDVAVLGSSTAITNGVGIFNGSATGALSPGSFTALSATDLGAIKLKVVGGPNAIADPFSAGPPADMNSDGIVDLVTLCKTSATVSILTGNGAGAFTLQTTTSVPATNPTSMEVADIDDSGTLDVVTANQGVGGNGTITVLLGNGANALAVFGSVGVPGLPASNFTSIVIGDVNFDCRNDVVVASYGGDQVSVFLGNGNGSFSTPVQYHTERPDLRATADIAGIAPLNQSNGLAAIVVADRQTSSGPNSFITLVPRHVADLYFGNLITPPIFSAQTQGVQPQSVAFGDLNGDARADMVVCNRASSNVQVFLGDGSGNFTQPFAPIPLKANALPESIMIGRVDNTSGSPSVLVACNGSNEVALLRNFGGGSLASPTYQLLDGTGPHQVLVTDINADGNPDIITVNQLSNNLTILLGNGLGTFTRATNSPYPTGNGPLSAAFADIDNNGTRDIAVCNFASDSVSVLLATSTSPTNVTFNIQSYSLTTATRGTVEPRSIAIGDLNGDSALDIVTADGFTNTFTVIYGKLRGRLTVSGGSAPNVGDLVLGPPIGIDPGFSPNITTSYNARITNVVSPTVVDVTDFTGGGILLGGEANLGQPLSSLVPTAFYFGDALSGQNILGTYSLGAAVALTNVRPTGTFFTPSDYENPVNGFGYPPVVVPTGRQPSVVKLFDMNNDGFLDIVVASQDAAQIDVYISQAPANVLAFQTQGLIQTAGNTPPFRVSQTGVVAGAVVNQGGPFTRAVCPAGEFTFIAADQFVPGGTSIYNLPGFPANPHSGYPIRSFLMPIIGPNSAVKFTAMNSPGKILGMDIAHVTIDCPPSVVVVGDDNTVRVYKAN